MLAIAIPSYNNPALLATCLESLANQTNKNFSVYVFDDAGNGSTLPVVKTFPQLNINYQKATINLGALANMCFAYSSLVDKHEYVMVMHEDDFLHARYIQAFYEALDYTNNLMVLFISDFIEVDENATLDLESETEIDFAVLNKNELCFQYLQQTPLAFGSIIYKCSIFKTMKLDLKLYAEFADRPFILNNITNEHLIGISQSALYYYRSHGENDARWKNLIPENVFSLLKLYREILVKTAFISNKVFIKHATGFICESFKNLNLTGKKYFYFPYLLRAKKYGFISLKYTLLKITVINKTGTYLKQFFN